VKLAPATLFSRTMKLKRLLRIIDKVQGTSFVELVPAPRKPQARRVTVTTEEVRRMLEAANPPLRFILAAMITIGLRWSEAAGLSPENWDDARQVIAVKTKGGKIRTFPVPDAFAHMIRQCPDTTGTYVERLSGQPFNKHTAWSSWWRYLRKRIHLRPEVRPHDLRRTAAVRLYTLTNDILAVKAFLGHDNLASTAYYLEPYDEQAMQHLQRVLKITNEKGQRVQ
jgi:integrase